MLKLLLATDIEHSLKQEGAAARAMDMTITACPPFKLDEMWAAWRQGWTDEDRRRSRNK
jgi:hypothetical protein